MNLPNKLTIARILMIPLFMVFLAAPLNFMTVYARLICSAAIFILASVTDMLDGKIARKYNLVTDFGKFMDPLADKFLVFAAMICILVFPYFSDIRNIFVWAAAIVIFRELAVTSMRLVIAGKDGIVIAASWLGKVKTVTQIVCISTILLEPVLFGTWCDFFNVWHPLTYLTMLAMSVMTVWSGIDYMRAYWKYIDPQK